MYLGVHHTEAYWALFCSLYTSIVFATHLIHKHHIICWWFNISHDWWKANRINLSSQYRTSTFLKLVPGLRLTVNTSITYFILLSNSITTCQPLNNLSMLNADILQVDQTKFFGITFDKNLCFKQHISQLYLKVSKIISLLLKVNNFFFWNSQMFIYIMPILTSDLL